MKIERRAFLPNSSKPFEIMEHTADVGIVGYGEDLKEVFKNTAIGMFSLIADLDTISNTIKAEVEVEAEDVEGLMVAWLNELIYLFEIKGAIFKEFDILRLGEGKLKALACGEKIDPLKHKINAEIKAATYHLLKIEKQTDKRRFRSQVLFDV